MHRRVTGIGLWFVLGAFSLLWPPAPARAGPTYYVDAASGNDSRTAAEAENPLTPWKTINKAVSAGGLIGMTNKGVILDGYTVIVQPGVYMESVESKRDGLESAPVIILAASPGSVTVLPPPGSNGFFVSHHYHVIDGFLVTGGANGIKLGPHDGGDGPVSGLIAQHNEVWGNSSNGIQFANAQGSVAALNHAFDNGQNGILYQGNGSAIHDNVVHGNSQFGIYVPDGINHQVWNNVVYGNGRGDIKIQGSQIPPPGGRTFFVSLDGNDSYSDVQAQSPQTPWRTFLRALQGINPGDTLAILPGVYATGLQSVRDGAAAAPITIRAHQPGTVTIAPGSGSGVYIGHHDHVVEGLIVTGATTGLQLGPYKQTGGQVANLVASGNVVHGNGLGIKFTNVTTATATHNIVHSNAKDGILYAWGNQSSCPPGSGATIFNNLVYSNGTNLSGEYGITVGCGDSNQVINNTVHGNRNGGIRMGVSGDVPVFGMVLNNIVVGSPVGVKEPAGSNYTGRVILDFNDVYGNTLAYGLGPLTRPGPGSISVPPGFVDAAGADFRLGRIATGQPGDSAAIDRGSDLASEVGLAGRTAFTDKYPDVGRVDLGYHGTLLYPSQGTVTIGKVSLTFDATGASLALSATLRPGAGGDGMSPGRDYAHITVGDLDVFLWTAGARQQGSRWVFTGDGGAVSGVLEPQADGSMVFTVKTAGQALAGLKFPTSVGLRLGDDFGSASLLLSGTLRAP
jgi:hypothetical protein